MLNKTSYLDMGKDIITVRNSLEEVVLKVFYPIYTKNPH